MIWLQNSIKLSIFRNMEFETLLNSRLACSDWNDLIATEVLPYRASLRIQIDKSKVAKKFRKGEWDANLTGYWDDITVHYPEDPAQFAHIAIFNWGSKSSSFRCFSVVTKVILFECGKATFIDFVHSILAGLPHLRHVEIKSQHWASHARLRYQPTTSYRTTLSSWTEGLKRAARLLTFRIAVFGKRTTIKYLNLLSVVDAPLKLVTLDVDLSKNAGHPLNSITVDEVGQLLVKVIQNCQETLQNLRIKWDHRVEGDLNLVRYSRDFDPYALFILMVASNRDLFHGLCLKRLSLNFPVMAFVPVNLVNEVLVPFIWSQEATLEKLTFSRVRWESSVRSFLSNFTPQFTERIEMGVFMVDVDTSNGLRLVKGVSKVEFHSLGTTVFDLNSMNARKTRCRRSGTVKFKKHLLTSLRFQNSAMNPTLNYINIHDILHNFRLLQDLELIDHSDNRETRSYSNNELNHIFLKLPHLKSLKMTNLRGISDAGLTHIPDCEISRMTETGVLYMEQHPLRSPLIIQAASKTTSVLTIYMTHFLMV